VRRGLWLFLSEGSELPTTAVVECESLSVFYKSLERRTVNTFKLCENVLLYSRPD
jgi:hypothetical protein